MYACNRLKDAFIALFNLDSNGIRIPSLAIYPYNSTPIILCKLVPYCSTYTYILMLYLELKPRVRYILSYNNTGI